MSKYLLLALFSLSTLLNSQVMAVEANLYDRYSDQLVVLKKLSSSKFSENVIKHHSRTYHACHMGSVILIAFNQPSYTVPIWNHDKGQPLKCEDYDNYLHFLAIKARSKGKVMKAVGDSEFQDETKAQRISRLTGQSEETVLIELKALEDSGLIYKPK